MLQGFKFEIYPSEEQKVLFWKTVGCNRLVWNLCLDYCKKVLKELGNQISEVQTEIEHTCSHCKHFQREKYDYEIYGGQCLIQEYTYKDVQGNERTANKDVDHLGTCDNFEKEEK